MLTLDKIYHAKFVLKQVARKTDLIAATRLCPGTDLYLKTENLQVQYPCVDIYGRHRYIDFALESPESKIAIEIDGETYHIPSKVSENKYADDLLKQNSLIYDNWKVYRWIYS